VIIRTSHAPFSIRRRSAAPPERDRTGTETRPDKYESWLPDVRRGWQLVSEAETHTVGQLDRSARADPPGCGAREDAFSCTPKLQTGPPTSGESEPHLAESQRDWPAGRLRQPPAPHPAVRGGEVRTHRWLTANTAIFRGWGPLWLRCWSPHHWLSPQPRTPTTPRRRRLLGVQAMCHKTSGLIHADLAAVGY